MVSRCHQGSDRHQVADRPRSSFDLSLCKRLFVSAGLLSQIWQSGKIKLKGPSEWRLNDIISHVCCKRLKGESNAISWLDFARGIVALQWKSLIQTDFVGNWRFTDGEAFNGTTVYIIESPALDLDTRLAASPCRAARCEVYSSPCGYYSQARFRTWLENMILFSNCGRDSNLV